MLRRPQFGATLTGGFQPCDRGLDVAAGRVLTCRDGNPRTWTRQQGVTHLNVYTYVALWFYLALLFAFWVLTVSGVLGPSEVCLRWLCASPRGSAAHVSLFVEINEKRINHKDANIGIT